MARRDGIVKRAYRRAVAMSGLAVLAVLLTANAPAAGEAASTGQYHPWTLTLAAGTFMHEDIIDASSNDCQRDLAFEIGIAHLLGSHLMPEFSLTVTTPHDDFGAQSLLVLRGQLRVYPTLDRYKFDQFFLLGGIEFATGEHGTCGRRFAIGPEAGLGMDFSLGHATSVFAQVSVLFAHITEGTESTEDTGNAGDTPPGGDRPPSGGNVCSSVSSQPFHFMGRLTAGVRIGL